MEPSTESPPLVWRTPEPPEAEPGYEPPSPVKEDRGLLKRIGAAIVALGALIAKLGSQLKFLILLLPKAKVFATAGSMLVSIGAYGLIWGWQFGAGFALLLLVHELGHAIQLRREGIKAGPPVFIPFLGAYIGMKQMPKNAAMEARVGLAGPVLGPIGRLVPLPRHGVEVVVQEVLEHHAIETRPLELPQSLRRLLHRAPHAAVAHAAEQRLDVLAASLGEQARAVAELALVSAHHRRHQRGEAELARIASGAGPRFGEGGASSFQLVD